MMRRLLFAALALSWAVGMFGRAFWTPDEPREADLAWRMSWQSESAVPLLAGEAFCEKPPLTYWISGAAIRWLGNEPWVARLPNFLYAMLTALGLGLLGARAAGRLAGMAAAAAIATLFLPYQVSIWLATDAPLLACVSLALLGAYRGFYAVDRGERLRGYFLMHAALAVGFLSKSAAAWMVPALTLLTLAVWERRLRELWRWELYVGLLLQAVIIGLWVAAVYVGPEGPARLGVFFWNNLVGRFARVDAPEALQYAAAHRNTPGKYFLELPLYLWPWTLLVIAAARRAWLQRGTKATATASVTTTATTATVTSGAGADSLRPVRFAIATFLPTLIMLSFAATARNIYLAPALPGIALLLGWWVREADTEPHPFDLKMLKATTVMIIVAAILFAIAAALAGYGEGPSMKAPLLYVTLCAGGIVASLLLARRALASGRRGMTTATVGLLLLAYCTLLTAPASQVYRVVDGWQDLSVIGRTVRQDLGDRPLVLFAADETTRAWVDMYVSPTVDFIPGPIGDTSLARLRSLLDVHTDAAVIVLWKIDNTSPRLAALKAKLGLKRTRTPPDLGWARDAHLEMIKTWGLPNGRVYALLEPTRAIASR